MNNLKKIVVVAILSFTVFSAFAQDSKFSTNINAGVSGVFILDSGYGFQFGVNSAYNVIERFAIEGALSYQRVNIISGFLSGEVSQENYFNALVGGRVYLNKADKRTRFYANALVGAAFNETEGTLPSISLGLYAVRNNFLIGIATETPQNLALKIGYNF